MLSWNRLPVLRARPFARATSWVAWEARNSSLFFPPRSRTLPSPPSACDLHSPQPASFATVSGSRRRSVSGVASGSPPLTLDSLITRADQALYRAKANGRDRVETADDELAGASEAIVGERVPMTRRKSRRQEKGAVNNSALQVASRRAMPGRTRAFGHLAGIVF